MMRKILVLFVVLTLALGVGAVAAYHHWQSIPVYEGDTPLVLEVKKGASMRSVSTQLATLTDYPYPAALSLYARYQGLASKLKAGEFSIEPGLKPAQFLDVLISGKTVSYPLTVIEGWTFAQMRDAVNAHPAIRHTVTTSADVMEALGRPDLHPEGRFYPDTYFVTKGQSDVDVYRQAFDTMTDLLNEAWAQRDKGLVLASPDEALILASIIEKETGADDERGKISGVFHRRLQIGMRLQTDPTVIYGVGDAYRGDITRKHLTTDTPYNTYTRAGLTPTPIALPGKASLLAAVKPEEGDALFFVATGEGDGRHYFSATLDEHNRAVQRYLTRTRERR